MVAKAVEASGTAQLSEQLKPADKLCDVPRWGLVSTSPRSRYSPAASSIAETTGAVAPSLVGVVVLLI